MEEQQQYYKLLAGDRAPHPAPNIAANHLTVEAHFSHLYLQPQCCYQKLITMGEGRNVDQLVNRRVTYGFILDTVMCCQSNSPVNLTLHRPSKFPWLWLQNWAFLLYITFLYKFRLHHNSQPNLKQAWHKMVVGQFLAAP